jgi:hypothetical protein
MTPYRMIAASLVLGLLCAVTGCPKKNPPAPAAPTPSNSGLGGTLGRAPEGGSQTVFGTSRDRAVDTQIMNEMSQVKLAIDADSPDGKGPANAAAWKALLRDFRHLRTMLEKGELVAYPNVDLRKDPNAVLMYETRVAKGDGIVLTCDGVPHRMNKQQLDALPRPK